MNAGSSGDLGRVLVVGAGLIGTSVALALRDRGIDVYLRDRDAAAVRLAAELGAGVPWNGEDHLDLAVLAVPPSAVPAALLDAQRADLARGYTDVASVKMQPIAGAEALGCDLATFVGGHPLGGRERSGPAAGRADLFLGRPWALCPTPTTKSDATDAAMSLARACGAEPVVLSSEDHDRAVALVSHAPHAVASAMAAQLSDADPAALALSGQGLRDVTRIAAGDAELWTGILAANVGPVADVLDRIAADLVAAAAALRSAGGAEGAEGGDAEAAGIVTELLRRGNAGRSHIPGKRGGPAPSYAIVPVVISDRPGELARLFDAVGEAGINIEDVAIEHSPGLPVGVAELSVRPDDADELVRRLGAQGWSVHR
ncbi:MAG: prephenate dehydrogenase [Streptosporangiales bacterium]|nr:prephenate dehydrogenase [Streptosporangiales bacterium]